MTGNTSAITFLEKIQGLILGSTLNNTYKMALIIAVAEISLEFRPENLQDPCRISYARLAREFLQLYWPQSVPFMADRGDLASPLAFDLRQGANTGLLKIITLIRDFKTSLGDPAMTFTKAELSGKPFERLVKTCVTGVVRKNPLEYLKDAEFLYTLDDKAKGIVLNADTVLCLQRFHPLIISLAQNRWEQRIRDLEANVAALGGSRVNSLHDYLFNPHRADNLTDVREVLQDTTGASACFYCGRPLHASVHVDHFIPYSRFTPTRIHNFVLACPHCNTSKSDVLASDRHLAHWMERNALFGDALTANAEDIGIPADRAVIEMRALALYEADLAKGAAFWDAASDANHASPNFLTYRTMPSLDALRTLVNSYPAVP
jgi:5-methylcytosine-specific restriction endonuclease McrA